MRTLAKIIPISKAHVRAYKKQGPAGQQEHVKEHDTRTPAAHPDYLLGLLAMNKYSVALATRPRQTMLAAVPEETSKPEQEFAKTLDQAPEGRSFIIPIAPDQAKEFLGTWEKVKIGGDPFWKKKGSNKYKMSKEFYAFAEFVKKQLAEKQEPAQGKISHKR